MGHEIAYGRDEGIRVHHLHGINAAGVPANKIAPRNRQLPIERMPVRSAVRVRGKNPAFIEQRILTGSIKASHASNRVRYIG